MLSVDDPGFQQFAEGIRDRTKTPTANAAGVAMTHVALNALRLDTSRLADHVAACLLPTGLGRVMLTRAQQDCPGGTTLAVQQRAQHELRDAIATLAKYVAKHRP